MIVKDPVDHSNVVTKDFFLAKSNASGGFRLSRSFQKSNCKVHCDEELRSVFLFRESDNTNVSFSYLGSDMSQFMQSDALNLLRTISDYQNSREY